MKKKIYYPFSKRKLNKVATSIAILKKQVDSGYYEPFKIYYMAECRSKRTPLSRISFVDMYGEENVLDAEKLADTIIQDPEMTEEKLIEQLKKY